MFLSIPLINHLIIHHFICSASHPSILILILYLYLYLPLYLHSALSKEIEELNSQFREANGELDILQSEATLMFKRLAAASKLIEGAYVSVCEIVSVCE